MEPIRRSNVFKENPLYIFVELPISKYAATKNSAIPIHCPYDIGWSNMKIPAIQGTKSPAVQKSDVSATVPLFIAAKLNPDDAASIIPEKHDINNVLRLQSNPFPAIKISKSPSMPLNMLL